MHHPAAFAALLRGEPRLRATHEALDFAWQSGGPEGVPSDAFATLATAEVNVSAGRYRVRSVSDVGIRVFVDETVVIERWDRHGPTEDVAELDLSEGSHTLRVEHFEIDGWAHLGVRLEPLLEPPATSAR
ncbi:MAG: PA14 domain-containing protein [Planctomycetota bacterium]